ncbi:MAG: DUF3795 domain-containing protein [bacterium]|nr:DUF3795 domain-containing protein [bacterium]
MAHKEEWVAPCGLYCGVCPVYVADHENNKKLKKELAILFVTDPEEVHCEGCMCEEREKIFFFCRICLIKTCVKDRKYKGCHECNKFPCFRIDEFPIPITDKIIERSITRRKKIGINKWVEEEIARYTCPHCGNKLIRGEQLCRKCENPVDPDLLTIKN